jgi:hypothetical protein
MIRSEALWDQHLDLGVGETDSDHKEGKELIQDCLVIKLAEHSSKMSGTRRELPPGLWGGRRVHGDIGGYKAVGTGIRVGVVLTY